MPQRVVTPGGLEVWYVHEPSIPIIALSVAFEGGSALDPPDQAGLASFAASLLNEGAGEMDSLAFQKAVVDRAIRLDFDVGRDFFSAELQTLSQHRDEAFRLLGLALAAPRFDRRAVKRIRRQILSVLAEAENEPDTVAVRSWFAEVFPDHPYGRIKDGTPESIAAIARGDLKAWAARRLARNNLTIGAAGDVSPEELGRLVDLAFGALPAEAAPVDVAEASVPSGGRVIVKRMPLPQSVVTFGMAGLKRDDPDFYAAYVMNHILGGGGFTSRLHKEVREKRGLAYSVYSYIYPLRRAGLYAGSVATRNDRVAETLELVRQEIARIAETGVSETELKAAQTHVTGAFPLRFDSGAKIAGTLVTMQLNDLGIDYIQHRNDYINAVTSDDIARVARRLLDPERLVVVVVGDPAGIESTP
jgi:zinc protease